MCGYTFLKVLFGTGDCKIAQPLRVTQQFQAPMPD